MDDNVFQPMIIYYNLATDARDAYERFSKEIRGCGLYVGQSDKTKAMAVMRQVTFDEFKANRMSCVFATC